MGQKPTATREQPDFVHVWLIRHGERADEVSQQEFATRVEQLKKIGIRGDINDAPLTQAGKVQAKSAGARLSALQLSTHRIFSSPFQRTLQTAAEVATALQLPITPLASAGSCAAFVKSRGLSTVLRESYFVDPLAMQRLCGDGAEVSEMDSSCESLRKGCERLARANPKEDLLIVTHREGMYDIISDDPKGCNERWRWGTPPYCCIVKLKLWGTGKWELVSFDV